MRDVSQIAAATPPTHTLPAWLAGGLAGWLCPSVPLPLSISQSVSRSGWLAGWLVLSPLPLCPSVRVHQSVGLDGWLAGWLCLLCMCVGGCPYTCLPGLLACLPVSALMRECTRCSAAQEALCV
jgi:hypothetical protein